ncbi:MAG: FadR family transcriptional regulator [Hyphomicrobiales bacterium]|nr:FadR family transcriptional regulator [Hyphomicrobiales bacterium]MDE2018080.1 FadR family transcriptional regulator [Hyphomicrobiales bacterium]
MPFQAVQTQKLYQRVADQLAGLIRAGELKPGARLPAERDLARQLGVSRPTLREAMIALEIAGLVEVRTGAGITVRDATAAGRIDAGPSAFDLLAARKLVEGETAALAAAARTDIDVAALDQAIASHRADFARGGDGFGADRAFHLAIARAAGNSALEGIVVEFWDSMRGPIFGRLTELTRLPAKDRTNLADHVAIRDAIAARDAGAARAAMGAHIAGVEAYFLGEADAAPDRGAAPGVATGAAPRIAPRTER